MTNDAATAEDRVLAIMKPYMAGVQASQRPVIARQIIAAAAPSATILTPDQFAEMLWNTIIIDDMFDPLAPFKPHLDRAIKVMTEHARYLITPAVDEP